jgi:hypothetical protein
MKAVRRAYLQAALKLKKQKRFAAFFSCHFLPLLHTLAREVKGGGRTSLPSEDKYTGQLRLGFSYWENRAGRGVSLYP